MGRVELNGWDIYFEDHGEGAVVLLVHGLLMDRTMFAPQVETLKGSYRIVTPDLRGHGDSESRDEDHTQWDMMEDHIALLDHLGIEKAVFGGVSQGGFQSLRAALKHPERVEGLILIETQAGEEDPNLAPMYEAMADLVTAEGWNDEILHTAAISMFGASSPEELKSHWMERWKANETIGAAASMRSVTRREDISDRLSEITVPALVIHGHQDVAIDISRAERLASGLSGLHEFVKLEEAGHSSTVEAPEEITHAIERFLKAVYG